MSTLETLSALCLQEDPLLVGSLAQVRSVTRPKGASMVAGKHKKQNAEGDNRWLLEVKTRDDGKIELREAAPGQS